MPTSTPTKPGRQPHDPEGPRSERVALRVTPELLAGLQRRAGKQPLNDLLNDVLRAYMGIE